MKSLVIGNTRTGKEEWLTPPEIIRALGSFKKDSSRDNLILIEAGIHQSLHNKGKDISDKTREAIVRFNHSRKGCRMRRKRDDITPKMVFQYREQGMSFNKISKITGLDWGCVKQRYIDAIHDNPEMLEDED